MKTLEKGAFLANKVEDAVWTTANTESSSAANTDGTAQPGLSWGSPEKGKWDTIEGKLISWGCNPSQLDEEETDTPSRDTIQLAIKLAAALCRSGVPSPKRVVPDAHGGIVFEIPQHGYFVSLHVMPSGEIEVREFENHRLIRRGLLEMRADC